jgi:hypothetical protein
LVKQKKIKQSKGLAGHEQWVAGPFVLSYATYAALFASRAVNIA